MGCAFETELDREYDGEDDGGASPSGSEQSGHSGQSESSWGMEKKAAWLLMNLSVRDGAWATSNTGTTATAGNTSPGVDVSDGLRSGKFRPKLTVADSAPRIKRRRATSL